MRGKGSWTACTHLLSNHKTLSQWCFTTQAAVFRLVAHILSCWCRLATSLAETSGWHVISNWCAHCVENPSNLCLLWYWIIECGCLTISDCHGGQCWLRCCRNFKWLKPCNWKLTIPAWACYVVQVMKWSNGEVGWWGVWVWMLKSRRRLSQQCGTIGCLIMALSVKSSDTPILHFLRGTDYKNMVEDR